jgi:hypothetical protein
MDRLAQYGSTGRSIAFEQLDEYADVLVSVPYERSLPVLFYKMGDDNLRILRLSDLDESFVQMEKQGYECEIRLPEQILGSPQNPGDFREVRKHIDAWLMTDEVAGATPD